MLILIISNKVNDMKKRILFVNKSFELGGIQTALKNMLFTLSPDKYTIDLLVFNDLKYEKTILPDYVNIIKCSLLVQTLGMTFSDVLKSKNIIQIIFKFVSTIWAKIFGNSLPVKFALLFQNKLVGYDYAVAYHHEVRSTTMVSGFVRFVLNKVEAKSKIGWIHSDFIATGINTKQNYKIYSKLDKIISVSRATMDSFVASYPSLKDKCSFCYNVLPSEDILLKSNEKSRIDISSKNGEVVFFSACRLVEEKGILRTLNVMKKLAAQKLSFKWYIAGDGKLKKEIVDTINAYNLCDHVLLLGYISNIYPYIKQCDWLLLPSFHETFSISAAEALILKTPVLATDIPVVRELINDDSGHICDNSEAGIEQGLKYVINASYSMSPCVINDFYNTNDILERIFI